jgi:hypothetical protein
MESKMRCSIVFFCAALGLGACGPGFIDDCIPILGGYSYLDSGGGETMIVLNRDDGNREIVVDARVDDYRVSESTIYVARRPRLIFVENGVPKIKNSNECEIYLIKTSEKIIEKLDAFAVRSPVNCK